MRPTLKERQHESGHPPYMLAPVSFEYLRVWPGLSIVLAGEKVSVEEKTLGSLAAVLWVVALALFLIGNEHSAVGVVLFSMMVLCLVQAESNARRDKESRKQLETRKIEKWKAGRP